ncbi:GNAT family N-acetyltransferase [Endozoicomonas gorgoniicola]|uniref:GNAT family N-acetyltransferase n=1 Tax=Endozoicomonas gorgoniicola TaxID=1234144 RepID=A0ABT3MRQ3_9GAMM|nr:GNAT family N-acetyltransferase [Endozoicomonas gorgoniicola]MCW7552051.1 GNAT family N-acetyltransferase [Endozoicomonas gorgoniicola]
MIEEMQPVAYPLVNRFFKANGHKGKARSDERVFVLRSEGEIIAALRACPRSEGFLLRSVWVALSKRGCGYGLELVKETVEALSPLRCWCYPYQHLRHFYALAGFEELAPEAVPADIAMPWRNYRKNGQVFLLMGGNVTSPSSPSS